MQWVRVCKPEPRRVADKHRKSNQADLMNVDARDEVERRVSDGF